MPAHVVFPYPFVKQVIFQIRFPSLFFLENRIGDFQIEIMRRFPKSQLLVQHEVIVVRGDEERLDQLRQEGKAPRAVMRTWRFMSAEGVVLDATIDSLTLESKTHKSYKGDNASGFRDAIQFACEEFIKVTRLPIISRIGLRYIDHCPVPGTTNEDFSSYYHSSLPLGRFSIADATEMTCTVAVRTATCMMRYMEKLQQDGKNRKLILDFDAWSENVDPRRFLEVADSLHEVLWDEFRNRTLKEPAVELMKKGPEAFCDVNDT